MSPPPPPHQPPHHHHQPPHQPPHRHHQPPPPPPAQYQLYPYPPPHHHHKRSSKTLASCILATCFLLTLVVAAAITLFILFRPQNPVIAITAVKLPTFTPNSTLINFTLLQYSTVRNPNRYDFTHHSSSVQLNSLAVGPVGFIYIPAARIGGGRTQDITAEFEVKSLSAGPGPTLEVETKMRLVGSVKVMQVFAHHVDTSVSCRVSVQLSNGALLGFHC